MAASEEPLTLRGWLGCCGCWWPCERLADHFTSSLGSPTSSARCPLQQGSRGRCWVVSLSWLGCVLVLQLLNLSLNNTARSNVCSIDVSLFSGWSLSLIMSLPSFKPSNGLFPCFGAELRPKLCWPPEDTQSHCRDPHGHGSLLEIFQQHLLRAVCPSFPIPRVLIVLIPVGSAPVWEPNSTHSPAC